MIIGTKGLQFTRDGVVSVYAGQSCFKLLERFENKEDVAPILANYRALLNEVTEIALKTGDGAWLMPVLRVFTQYHGKLGNYRVKDYRSITALNDWCYNEFGFIIDWECLADVNGQAVEEMRHHVEAVARAIRNSTVNGLLSLGNEYHGNGWKPEDFIEPPDITCSRGSDFGDYLPPLPAWKYTKFHTRRDGLKGQLAAQDLAWINYDMSGWDGPPHGVNQPVILDEPIGFADTDIPNRRSSHPSVAFRLAQESAEWGNGGTFHSDCGIESKIYTETQWACGLAFMMGLSKVDPVQSFNGTF